MSSGASSSLSAEAGEFSDDGIDWVAAVDTLTETEKKMQAAAKREEEIAGLIADHATTRPS